MRDFTKVTSSVASVENAGFDAGLRKHMLKVYNYMGLALVVSGLLSYFAGHSEAYIQTVFTNPILYWGIALAPLAMVFFLSIRIEKMSMQTAQITFWAFASVMGLSLASIFLMYTEASIFKTFLATAGTFGAMSLYGYTTKRDLSGMGSFLIMGLFGIIIASVVNIFLQSSALDFAVSILGVLIFIGLTAYDTQRIKQLYFVHGGQGETGGKAAIMGALSLYLDFINLLLFLLRFMGDRR
ncbi:MAG: hypothetical protein COV36_00830 [Alphaproteobacteria bacterium CG11_big_fil_rev_8_21_14_0_20_44_7]|nr:MAG: hypothetical protein COV36_00830 [Alphaproteobacteria bacterium CG11_big_fil_rev_8_21_14_0_20_44_7]